MITLRHNEAFAYDLLAIAQIKALRNPDNEEACLICLNLAFEIERQVGREKHEMIIVSREYLNLYRVNDEIYVRVDEAKVRGEQVGDHRYIDDRVYQRWLAKRALQKQWFPEELLTEQKMGYEKVLGEKPS